MCNPSSLAAFIDQAGPHPTHTNCRPVQIPTGTIGPVPAGPFFETGAAFISRPGKSVGPPRKSNGRGNFSDPPGIWRLLLREELVFELRTSVPDVRRFEGHFCAEDMGI